MMTKLPGTLEYHLPSEKSQSWPREVYLEKPHQVCWRLGDIAPGATVSAAVNLMVHWGLPAHLEGSMNVELGTSNLDSNFDVDDYLNYQSELVGEQSLAILTSDGSRAYIEILRRQCLHDLRQKRRFRRGAGDRYRLTLWLMGRYPVESTVERYGGGVAQQSAEGGCRAGEVWLPDLLRNCVAMVGVDYLAGKISSVWSMA